MATALLRSALYEEDDLAWIEQQVALLRAGRTDELDLSNLIEELGDMGRAEWRELENRLETLLAHMLKRDCQPEKRSRSSDNTIDEQRRRLERLFKRSPSLQRNLADTLAEMYPYAVRKAVRETKMSAGAFPAQLPYSVEQVLREEPPSPD
jgi:hypothetical protein